MVNNATRSQTACTFRHDPHEEAFRFSRWKTFAIRHSIFRLPPPNPKHISSLRLMSAVICSLICPTGNYAALDSTALNPEMRPSTSTQVKNSNKPDRKPSCVSSFVSWCAGFELANDYDQKLNDCAVVVCDIYRILIYSIRAIPLQTTYGMCWRPKRRDRPIHNRLKSFWHNTSSDAASAIVAYTAGPLIPTQTSLLVTRQHHVADVWLWTRRFILCYNHHLVDDLAF